MSNLYVDVHVLQTVPPSCLNRDDTGSPKTAVYGGARRARVSSPSWKRAMRRNFSEYFDRKYLGLRTLRAVQLIADRIMEMDPEKNRDEAEAWAAKAFGLIGKDDPEKKKKTDAAGTEEPGKEEADVSDTKGNKKPGGKKKAEEKEKDVLFFISCAQADAMADLFFKKKGAIPSKTAVMKIMKENISIDIALFGRMVAKETSLDCEAAAQVAHAISTHKVATEYDYFTAVDDYPAEDGHGSAHIGTTEFNSSTLYRYASLNVKELAANLGESGLLIEEVVIGFVSAFILSMPTGKQNSFANRTVPDMAYVTVRSDQPVNLCGAFEKPVKAGDDGYVQNSIESLAKYAGRVYADFADAPCKAYVVGTDFDGAQRKNLKGMLGALREDVKAALS